jgi:predicted DNA-binding ribbon-helix-helix protein
MTKGFKSPNVHNVWLRGRYTSISVEPDFWEQFRLIVIERRTTISNLLAEIERTMRLLPDLGKGYDRTLTLSAAVRVFVLRTVMSQLSSRRGAPRHVPHQSPWSLPPGMHSRPRQDDAHAPER